jgi:acyl-CoA synthetase (NDP forming)
MTSPETIRFADITGLLYPKSVAVIGASDRPGNFGGDTIERLLRFKFPGPVYAVNPNGGTARGLNCYRSVKDLPEAPESAIFAIPGAAIIDAIKEIGALGTKNGVAFAGGFAEAGGEGIELQKKLVETCKALDFKLCGPNCAGILNVATPVTSTFATSLHEVHTLIKGPISVVTQSGGIGTTVFFSIQERGFGGRHLISGGNEAVVSIPDYIYGLAHDDGTEVIAVYLESVGNGVKLVRALEEARKQGKPVVMIKSGVTSASARAALAHTGALVGEDRVFDAILQELGVIRVSSVEEMADVCLMLAGTPRAKRPKGPGVGLVTFGGGNGVLAADQAAKYGLTVPALDAEHTARVKPLLISVASASNPMDLTPTTAFRVENLERLPKAMSAMAAQPDIQSMLLIAGQMHARKNEVFEVFRQFVADCEKNVCLSWPTPPAGISERFAGIGIPLFNDFDRGLRALGRMAAHGVAQARPQRPADLKPISFDWSAFVAPGETVVSEDRCHAIMRKAGLPVAPGDLAKTEADALRIAQEAGLPVVMKGITPKVTHRAAAGLLAVDLRTKEDVADAFRRLQARAKEIGVALDGVYVQKMARGGVELLVTAFRDPIFGPMISCGSGGGLTEQLDDVVTSRAPVDEAVAADLLGRTRLIKLAKDANGPLDTKDAAAFIAKLSQLAAGAPWPRFTFEVNPGKWSRSGVVAVDGLLVIEKA